MASSNGRIGGSGPRLRAGARSFAFSSARYRSLVLLLIVLVVTAAPSAVLSAPPASPAPPAKYTPPFTSAPPSKNNPPATSKKTPGKDGQAVKGGQAVKDGKEKEVVNEILRARANTAMEANELHETRAALLALLSTRFSINAVCNLGLVARRLKLAVEAAENLNRCVRAYAAVPIAPRDIERYDELRAERAMALGMVATVRLVAPQGAPVIIDGVPSGVASPAREIFLTPGPHVIVVQSRRHHLDLRASSAQTLDFTPAKPPPPPRERKSFDPLQFAGWAGAAAAMGTTGGLVAMAEIFRRTAEGQLAQVESINGGYGCSQSWRSPESCNSYMGDRNTSITLYVAAGSSFLLGAALIAGTRYYTSGTTPRAGVTIGLGSLGLEAAW